MEKQSSGVQRVSPEGLALTRPYLDEEEEAAVAAVLRSGWLTQGPQVEAFEREVASYVGARYACATSSCTTALQVALLALDLGPGDEVILPSFTFVATANAVVHCGATPVFADIMAATYNVDPARVEEAISPRTRLLLPVHQFGLPAEMARFQEISQRRGLPILEDAACALGARCEGRSVGTFGAAGCFSFHPRKIITTGEGGMVVTDDQQLDRVLRALRSHGASVSDLDRHRSAAVSQERYERIGFNFRMSDLQAAVGLAQMRKLPHLIERREALAALYDAGLEQLGWVWPTPTPRGAQRVYQSYVVRLADDAPLDRHTLMEKLASWGIATRRGAVAIHLEPAYAGRYQGRPLPETERAAAHCLALPLGPHMDEGDVERVVDAFRVIG